MLRLVGKLLVLVSYAGVATLIAEVAGVVYLRASGILDNDRLNRVVAAARGLDKDEATHHEPRGTKPDDEEQPSYDEREQARDLQTRQLEMREQALKSGLDRIRFEQRSLTRDKARYDALEGAFDQQLDALKNKALSAGRENVRMIWENIKPKQAKEQILQMIENNEMNEVVTILSAMPIGKRAKIVSEFKSAEETAKLDEMLRLIRQGVPEVNVIDKTRSQLQQP